MYDYLVVGAGLAGSVFAHEMNKKGYSCFVIDQRSHVGGNLYCVDIEGIPVHKYGPHIFHTNEKSVWGYVNNFIEFNFFINSPLAIYHNTMVNLPFNMNTFYKLWGVKTPSAARKKIEQQTKKYKNVEAKNVEEKALSLVGKDIYRKFIRGYTRKQWGKDPKYLPPGIITRIPLRFTFDNNYFSDKYQGIPQGGYNLLFDKLLEGIDIQLNTNYRTIANKVNSIARNVFYTGTIDGLFDYEFGRLDYRSLRFDTEILKRPEYQGNAVVNYTSEKVPYTRIVEHKCFYSGLDTDSTVITREFPDTFGPEKEPYYPVNDINNNKLYDKYVVEASNRYPNFILGGRLGKYRYYDMDDIIVDTLKTIDSINSRNV